MDDTGGWHYVTLLTLICVVGAGILDVRDNCTNPDLPAVGQLCQAVADIDQVRTPSSYFFFFLIYLRNYQKRARTFII